MTPQWLPQRTYRNLFMDSTFWDSYQPRPDDIVISTPPKAGTTWTQRIVSVLVFQDTRLPARLANLSPWLDGRFQPLEQALAELAGQRHRRFIKTHLPMDALPIYPEVSYLVVGRDPRDTAVSSHHHMLGMVGIKMPPETARSSPEDDPGLSVFPPIPDEVRDYWRAYFTRGGFPWETNGWPVISPTDVLTSWWPHRDQPNVLFLHYQELLDDLDREMRRVSGFLGIPVDETVWPDLVRACTFAEMRRGSTYVPVPEGPGVVSPPKGFTFFHQGRNRQWKDFATEEDLALYRASLRPLPTDLREWLTRSG